MLVELDSWAYGQAFVLGYRFTDDSSEHWTKRFNAFKACDERAVRAGCAVMSAALKSVPIPAGPIVVLGVPGSQEQVLASRRPVAHLANAIANLWRAKFDLQLIRKNIHKPLHSARTIEGRQTILDGANFRTTRKYKDARSFIIVDDFLTRGDTMSRIATAIRTDTPDANFLAVAIAKTERAQYWLNRGMKAPENNEAAAFEAAWNEAAKAK